MHGDKEARETEMNVIQEKRNKGRPGDGCPWEKGEIQGRSREDP